MAPTLILMRHGKSAYPTGIADHERPLAPRGHRQAALAGQWLHDTQPPIDQVHCSTAVRTRQTLAATGLTAPVTYARHIYGAEPDTLIEDIQLTADTVQTLLIVGHDPGMPSTAWELAENRDSDAALELSRKFPTSALAVLRFECPWAQVERGTGELIAFQVPR